LDCRDTRRCNRNKSSGPGERVDHRLCDVGEADRRATFRRDGAPRIGRPRRLCTRVDQQAVETARGYVSRPRYSLGIASREAPGRGALPKNCHLLPFTAILESPNRHDRLNRFNSTLALRGRAGQPGPRAENRERGRQEPRCQAATECHLSHDRRIRQQSENAARRGDRRGYGRRQVGVEQ
jgi:hypothetical protein